MGVQASGVKVASPGINRDREDQDVELKAFELRAWSQLKLTGRYGVIDPANVQKHGGSARRRADLVGCSGYGMRATQASRRQ